MYFSNYCSFFQVNWIKNTYDKKLSNMEDAFFDTFDDTFFEFIELKDLSDDDRVQEKFVSTVLNLENRKNYTNSSDKERKCDSLFFNKMLNNTIKLSEQDSKEFLQLFKNKILKKDISLDYQLNAITFTDTLDIQKLQANEDYLLINPFGLFSFSYKYRNTQILSKIRYAIFSAILFTFVFILSTFLLAQKYLHEKKLLAYKNDFISNLAHELQTPITISNLTLEKMASLNTNSALDKSIAISQRENAKLAELSKRILGLAELDNISPNYEIIHPDELIQESVNRFNSSLEKNDYITTFFGKQLTAIKVDKKQFMDLINNLIDNAIKYSKTPRNISVTTMRKRGQFKIIVKDNGIGIPSELTTKIFEPFFKILNNNTHDVKGNGLGLSYVAKIVNKMKGTIIVTSKQEEGSEFQIVLPYED